MVRVALLVVLLAPINWQLFSRRSPSPGQMLILLRHKIRFHQVGYRMEIKFVLTSLINLVCEPTQEFGMIPLSLVFLFIFCLNLQKLSKQIAKIFCVNLAEDLQIDIEYILVRENKKFDNHFALAIVKQSTITQVNSNIPSLNSKSHVPMFSQYAKKCTSIYLDTRQRIKTKSIGKPYTKQSNKSVSLLYRLSGTFCRYSGPFIPFVPDAAHRESRPASPVKAYHSLNKRLVNILNYWYRTRIFIFPADLFRKLCISSSLIKKLVTKYISIYFKFYYKKNL